MRPCLICFFVHRELVKRLLVRPYSVRWFNMPYARIFCELRSISVSPLWAMKHTINDQNVALYVKPSNRGFIISLLFHFLVFWRPVLFETNAHTVLSEHRTNRTSVCERRKRHKRNYFYKYSWWPKVSKFVAEKITSEKRKRNQRRRGLFLSVFS